MPGHRGCLLVFASEQADGIPGVVVEDGERMTAAGAEREVALVFEALAVPRLSGRNAEQVVAAQEGGVWCERLAGGCG
jgi:hypothetical protein